MAARWTSTPTGGRQRRSWPTLTREYYLHYAGLKDDVRDRAHLRPPRGAVHRPGDRRSARAAATPPSRRATTARRLRMLLDFAVEGHLGRADQGAGDRARAPRGRADAEGRRPADGLPRVLRRPGQRARRRACARRSRGHATRRPRRELEPAIPRDARATARGCTARSGGSSYREMCAECKGDRPGSARTRRPPRSPPAPTPRYPAMLEPEVRRTLGHRAGRAAARGSPAVLPGAEADGQFPADLLVPSLMETLLGLGIDVADQAATCTSTSSSRPNKSPRAFCAPVRVPGEVHLVRHARRRPRRLRRAACTRPATPSTTPTSTRELSFEYRYLGDNSITEAYAFLFEHLIEDPEWLRAPAGSRGRRRRLLAHGRVQRLIYMRRYAAKLTYELELHGAPHGRSWDELSRALRDAARRRAAASSGRPRRTWPTSTRASTARATCGRGRWRRTCGRTCATASGRRGSMSARPGTCCGALWADGQRLDAEELLGELTGERLDFGVLLADLGLDG